MMSLVSSTMSMSMAITMDDIHDMDISGYSTITNNTNTPSFDGCDWNHWSPVVNWDAFTGGQDHFHGLMESMFDEDNPPMVALSPDNHGSNSDSTTEDPASCAVDADEVDDFKGLRLVHLLMAAAEALTGVNKSRDLARVILVRLKELVSPTHGTNMERLAAYFTEALQVLLDGAGGAHRYSKNNYYLVIGGPHRDELHATDMLAAFQLLQNMSPYVKFGHFTANQAILEAVAQERRVHIVDYDIMEGIQWASFMQALESNKTGPHLRITALTRGGTGRRSIAHCGLHWATILFSPMQIGLR